MNHGGQCNSGVARQHRPQRCRPMRGQVLDQLVGQKLRLLAERNHVALLALATILRLGLWPQQATNDVEATGMVDADDSARPGNILGAPAEFRRRKRVDPPG